MDEKQEYLEKIEKLINSADKFNEMSFRMVLEGLINKGGEESEYLLARYLNSKTLDFNTRINIIRVVGYLQSPHFLVPLKNIIDREENIHLKKEAVISVSKYNDRRALNILNHALSNLKNSLLLDTINNEIGKIKRNNPVYALLPRFLDGEKNPGNFEVTLGILKRILRPVDASMFVGYLHCGKPLIENGSFEILCYTGDLSHQAAILQYFQDRFNHIPCIQQPQCEDLYKLTLILKHYFLRFPSLVDGQLDNMGTQLFYVRDSRIRNLFISILCQGRQSAAIAFVSKIYDSDPTLRETIIMEYSGNEGAVNLLFEKYRVENSALSGLLIKSLLNSKRGIDYFYEQFFNLNDEGKKIVVNCLPYSGSHDLSEFTRMIFQSDLSPLKEILLTRIKEHYEFSSKEILFDPTKEKEFSSMEKEYLETIIQLFPITAMKKMLKEIAFAEPVTSKINIYLHLIGDIVPSGLTVKLEEKDLAAGVSRKILTTGNLDLVLLFLEILKHIKTFDPATYANLNEGLELFALQGDQKLSVEENDQVRKAHKNITDLYFEIRQMETGLKTLDKVFAREELDFDQLTHFFTSQSVCAALNIEQVGRLIGQRLAAAGREELRKWLPFFNRFPLIAFQLKDAIGRKANAQAGPESSALQKFYQALPNNPAKIVIRLTNKRVTAILREQFQELIPNIPVDTETNALAEEDMLLCDTVTIRDFILKNILPSRKLYLFLDNISEFESFKTYNPRPFVKPFSAYRIMKEVLKEIYL